MTFSKDFALYQWLWFEDYLYSFEGFFRAEYQKCHKNLTYFYVVEDYNGCRLSLFCALGNLRKCDLRLFFDVTPMGKWLRHSPCGFSASLIVFCEVFFVQFFTDGLMNIQTLYVICWIGLLQFSRKYNKDNFSRY